MITETASPTTELLEPDRPAPSPKRQLIGEVALLLVSPALMVLLLRPRVMSPAHMIDPYFYTAYSENGPDLIVRYGVHNYYWVRVAFILPARAAYLLFGVVGGFYVFRYVLALVAIVPLYLLFRRLSGRAMGAVAVAVFLSSPVILFAWGTDYPDSSAVSYLVAGIACLVMPARSRGRRILWVILGGVGLVLAVHSQFSAAPIVAAIVAAYLLVNWRRPIVHAVVDCFWLLATAAAVTVGLMIVSKWALGSSNLIRPTLDTLKLYNTPAIAASSHSTNWRWILTDPYLFAIPVLLAAWVLVRLLTGAKASPAEATVMLALAIQSALYVWLQFFHRQWTLEYYFYSSMLWSTACVGTAFLILRIWRSLPSRAGRSRIAAFVPFCLVLGVPLVLEPFRRSIRFSMSGPGAFIAAAAVLVAGVTVAARRYPVLLTTGLACFLGLTFVLTIGKPPLGSYPKGQAPLPAAEYGTVIANGDRAPLNEYRLITQIHRFVPRAFYKGDDLMVWWNSKAGDTVSKGAGQYLWIPNSLSLNIPALADSDVALLKQRRPSVLLLLSTTGAEFGPAFDSLVQRGFRPQVLNVEDLRAGPSHLHLEVLNMRGRTLRPDRDGLASRRIAPRHHVAVGQLEQGDRFDGCVVVFDQAVGESVT